MPWRFPVPIAFWSRSEGKIFSFVAEPRQRNPILPTTLWARPRKGEQLTQAVYALTVHPKFAENGYVFVTYIPDPRQENLPKGTRVARFKASGNPPKFDPASEKTIIEWHNGGHNGGALQFGNDGMLYIATGDASGIADERQTGQDLSDLFGASCGSMSIALKPDQGYVVPRTIRSSI